MTVLIEHHESQCSCSYCGGFSSVGKMRYGLNVPPRWWGWNSWYTIKYGPGRYLRFTLLSFLRRFQVLKGPR